MSVTDTLKTREAYEQAGIPAQQATIMAHVDEKHAGDVSDYIRQSFAADLARMEGALKSDLHSTVRQQTWSIIAWVTTIAIFAVGAAVGITGAIVGYFIHK